MWVTVCHIVNSKPALILFAWKINIQLHSFLLNFSAAKLHGLNSHDFKGGYAWHVEHDFSLAPLCTKHLGTWRACRKVLIAEAAAVGLIHCNVWPAATPGDGKCAMVSWSRWRGLLWRVEVEVEMEVTSLSFSRLPPFHCNSCLYT